MALSIPFLSAGSSYKWRFFRAGGFDQVRLESGADLLALEQLDLKLWAALSCPTRGLEFDGRTLDLLDTDKDGRVRAPEIISAVKWTASLLRDPGEILKGADALPLSSINDATPEGKQVLASAKQILANLGNKDATAVSAADTADTVKIFAATNFNGDGIIPVDSAEDDSTKAVINDIAACLGTVTDRSGKPGVNQEKADRFFAECQAYSDWWKKAEGDSTALPMGESTPSAAITFQAVKGKVDDYFARCRLAAFDARALAALNRQESEYLAVAAGDLTITAQEVAGFPLSRIEASRPLPLKEGLNPAWAGAIAKFAAEVVKPLLGDRASLSESDWTGVSAKFAPYESWYAGKVGATVEKLGLGRIREILGSKARDAVAALIAKDKALEPEANGIAAVDKLVRCYRDLQQLLVNFVSFEDFYSRKRKAVFQVGTLYLDGRSCDLCVRVDDAGKHAALAGLAKTYLAYCDCTRPSGEKMTVAAAFTGGDSDYLMVGRNGLFFDRKGRDWDATITKIIENPISIRQAFWSPYKKLVRLVEEQVAKRAAAADAATGTQLSAAATDAAHVDKVRAEQKKVDVGTVAAMGVAFGAIGSAFATLAGYLTGVLKLPFWQVCLAFAGLLLIISGPAMLIAWLKLRQRNLGPILDANGWAVNGRVKMNVPFGGALTSVAQLPPGAQAVIDDPFSEPPRTWPKLVLFVVIVCFIFSLLNSFGLIHTLTGGKLGDPSSKREPAKKEETSEKAAAIGNGVGSTNVLAGTNAPAK
ncbi:MAG TPA: hypothetical protein VN887_00085 [Candidatus Angelobacter sp.]|nr:hypothetical protein [Candidatus Angelobacter sp.]